MSNSVDRPVSVAIISVLGILFGAMGVLCSPFALLPYLADLGQQNVVIDVIKSNTVLYAWTVFSMVLGFFMSLLLLASSIGAIRMRQWGRLGMLLYAVAGLMLYVVGWIFNLTMLFPKLGDLGDPAVMGGAIGGLVGGCLGGVVYLLIIVIFMLPGVRRAYQAAAGF